MSPRTIRTAIQLCISFLLLIPLAVAQDGSDSDLQKGLRSSAMYHGGDLDSIDTASGKLTIHIPLWSYPQRGGKLHLTYVLRYDSPSFFCFTLDGGCLWSEVQSYLQEDTESVALAPDSLPWLDQVDRFDSQKRYQGTKWTAI